MVLIKPKPKNIVQPGGSASLTDGPFFANFNGVRWKEVNYEKSPQFRSLFIFGRPTPVELEFGQ